MLSGKTVLLAVIGSIAAYKILNLARLLKKQGCTVHFLMTEGAGFRNDTNVMALITKDYVLNLDKMNKSKVAQAIFDKLLLIN